MNSFIDDLEWIAHMAEIQMKSKENDTVSVWSTVGLSGAEDSTGLFSITGVDSVKLHVNLKELKQIVTMEGM